MGRTSLLLLAWAASSLAGCDQSNHRVDAGPDRDGSARAGQLAVESEASITLVFGEGSELTVRYTEEGAPISGVPLRFALEGLAHDSTVADLVVTTDAQGRARTSVIAGSTSTVFRVRVAAERAAPIYVDVSVGNQGFGALRIGALYDGARPRGVRRVIHVYSALTCAEEPPPFVGLSVTLDDPTLTEARFRALPTGLRYAVLAHLEGPAGVVLARACTDSVEVLSDAETRVDLVFVDEPLTLGDSYEVTVQLDPSASREGVAELLRASGGAVIDAAGSEAGLYLDALEAELRESGASSIADALRVERFDGTADDSLSSRLDAAGESPRVALLALVDVLRARLAVLSFAGPLSLTVAAGALEGDWRPNRLSIGAPGVPDAPPLSLDPVTAGFTLDPALAMRWAPESDALALDSLVVSFELGLLTDTIIAVEVANRGLDSAAKLLLARAGCAVLATWILESASIEPACDGECAVQVCLRALEGIVDVVDAAVMALDQARDRVEISGTLAARDEDGDLRVDRLVGAGLEGRWSSALDETGDPVGTSIAADRPASEE